MTIVYMNSKGSGPWMAKLPYEFIGFGAMDDNCPYECIGSGAVEGQVPYEFTGIGAMDDNCLYDS